MLNIKNNLRNSIFGLLSAWSDKSFKAEVYLGMLLLPLILTVDALVVAKIAVVINYLLVLVVELLNTALEKLCDRVTLDRDPAIKAVKDMASAAVFLMLLMLFAQCVFLLIGVPKL